MLLLEFSTNPPYMRTNEDLQKDLDHHSNNVQAQSGVALAHIAAVLTDIRDLLSQGKGEVNIVSMGHTPREYREIPMPKDIDLKP